MFLAGEHQAEQHGPVTPDNQHRPVLTLGRIVFVDHPRPHDLPGIRLAVADLAVPDKWVPAAAVSRVAFPPTGRKNS